MKQIIISVVICCALAMVCGCVTTSSLLEGAETFGCESNPTGSPIGGGEGYKDIVTDGDFRVSSIEQLREALKKAKSGQVVYVEEGAEFDFTALIFTEELVLEVPEGVTLAGNRGHSGSKGPLLFSKAFKTRPLIRAMGPNVRITGLRIIGPDHKRRMAHHTRSFNAERGDDKAQSKYYYSFPVADGIRTDVSNLTVDNCELSGWSQTAVSLGEGTGHYIHHNYMHHNQRHGLGYGVCVEEAEALIEANLFDWERHHIAGEGKKGCSYEARYNLCLENANGHLFDMHGGGDRKDGTSIAGTRINIHHNTFLSTEVAAFILRGVPTEKAEIHHNRFAHRRAEDTVIQYGGKNMKVYQNVFSPDEVLPIPMEVPSFGELDVDVSQTKEVAVEWDNTLSGDATFSITWKTKNRGWKIKPSRAKKLVNTKGKGIQVFRITSPSSNPHPVPTVSVVAKTSSSVKHGRANVPLHVRYKKRVPMSSSIESAASSGPLQLDHPSQVMLGVKKWQGARDCSGEIFVARDEKNLQIRVNVSDDALVKSTSASGLHLRDSIELYFDARPLDQRDATYGKADVYQILAGIGSDDKSPPLSNGRRLPGLKVTSRVKQNGYELVFTVPLKSLSEKMGTKGTNVGFDIGINDNDGSGTRDHQLILFGWEHNWAHPQYFGMLEF